MADRTDRTAVAISRVSASAGALLVLRFSILFYFAQRSGRFRVFVSKHS